MPRVTFKVSDGAKGVWWLAMASSSTALVALKAHLAKTSYSQTLATLPDVKKFVQQYTLELHPFFQELSVF